MISFDNTPLAHIMHTIMLMDAKDKDKTVFQLRLPSDVHEEIRVAAFKGKLSMNKWIIEAIRKVLKENGK